MQVVLLGVVPRLAAHRAVWIVAFPFVPFLYAVYVERVGAVPGHDGAIFTGNSARRAMLIEQMPTDPARVLGTRFAPRPLGDERHGEHFDLHNRRTVLLLSIGNEHTSDVEVSQTKSVVSAFDCVCLFCLCACATTRSMDG